ncbi:MAG: hypothetical protein WC100_12115 [Sterolibacterium sp.]
MDYGTNAVNAYSGQLGANVKRPETALESVISRLGTISSRIKSNANRADDVANTVAGFVGEASAGGQAMPAAVPTSMMDYLGEIEGALSRLEYNLGRITQ